MSEDLLSLHEAGQVKKIKRGKSKLPTHSSDLLDYSNSSWHCHQLCGTNVERRPKFQMPYSVPFNFLDRFACADNIKNKATTGEDGIIRVLPVPPMPLLSLSRWFLHFPSAIQPLWCASFSWHQTTTLVNISRWGALIRPSRWGCRAACRHRKLVLDMFVSIDDYIQIGHAIMYTGWTGAMWSRVWFFWQSATATTPNANQVCMCV